MKRNPKNLGQNGFALIVTLSLMILLTVIAVGLLTLSSVSLRSTSQGSAQAIANSNARLAMMMALGDLQATMGVDKAVSAPASSVFKSAQRPHLTGAWNSTKEDDYWHWTPDANGAPSFSSKKDRFRRWLVSTPTPGDAENFSFASSAAPAGVNAVTLVGGQTPPVTDSEGVSTTVVASKVKINRTGQVSKLAWAVFDESTKASINLGDPASKMAVGTEIASRNVPGRFRADALDSKLDALKTPTNVISLDTAKVLGGPSIAPEISSRFHDLTIGSVGLLSNTAQGGLRTDLTPVFEAGTMPTGFFPENNSIGPYPNNFTTVSGAPQWAYIRDHYRKYTTTTTDAGGDPVYDLRNTKVKDLAFNQTGLAASPVSERLLPVIAKFQIIFSIVSHYAHIKDRINYLNTAAASTGGYTAYPIPHLAYDPVITLYNPYDVSILLSKVRIRIWDPPVGFRFTKVRADKSEARYRGEDFQGLARFQIANQYNASARRCFTLVLSDGTPAAAGSTLKLKPGEVRVFSARVESNWSWSFETGGGEYSPRSFFDWDQGKEFGNRDARTNNDFGVEAVPGFDQRAGLQADHLSAENRGANTRYSWETSSPGFVYTNLNDSVRVECKPMVTTGTTKQFQVDVMAGLQKGTTNYTDPASAAPDRIRSYMFTFNGDPSAEMSSDPAKPIISKQYTAGEILQRPGDTSPGGKKAIAMLEMTARGTLDALNDSKPWLYNNPVTEGADQNSSVIGLTNQSYDLRLVDISSFKNFPDGVAIDPATNRGYFGAYGTPQLGSSFVHMMHVPLAPAASLGDLIATNLISGSAMPRVVHPFGNSRAHPLIPAGNIAASTGTRLLDHSYLLNDGLWDGYFFSSLADYAGGTGKVLPTSRSLSEVLTGVIGGTQPALNSRLIPVKHTDVSSKMADEIAGLSELERSRQIAKYIGINGPFNVNSTSVDAWAATLMSLRDREINGLKLSGSGTISTLANTTYGKAGETPFVRSGKPLTGSTPDPNLKWAGYRALDDGQITKLARLIVEEIRESGLEDSAPPFSLGEFVNRRPSSASSVHSLAGILQTAIDKSDINGDNSITQYSKTLNAASIPAKRKTGVKNDAVMSGRSAEGSPVMITQGDLMQALAPVATVRGDTFKIRGYGEATSSDGNTILARSWCEAVVQRTPEFVDPVDLPEIAIADLTSEQNKTFGRRFNVVSFRWLKESEL